MPDIISTGPIYGQCVANGLSIILLPVEPYTWVAGPSVWFPKVEARLVLQSNATSDNRPDDLAQVACTVGLLLNASSVLGSFQQGPCASVSALNASNVFWHRASETLVLGVCRLGEVGRQEIHLLYGCFRFLDVRYVFSGLIRRKVSKSEAEASN